MSLDLYVTLGRSGLATPQGPCVRAAFGAMMMTHG